VNQLVSFAEGGGGSPKALTDCSAIPKMCQSVFYFDPNILYDSALCPFVPDAHALAAASEGWFVHSLGYTDSAHRVQGTYTQTCNGSTNTVNIWALNETVPGVQAWYASYLQSNADAWDIYFMDNTEATITDQFYAANHGMCNGQLCTTTQEFQTNAAVGSEHAPFVAALIHLNGQPMRILFNGLEYDGQPTANNIYLFNTSSQLIATECEDCVIANGVFKPANYVRVLNSMNTINAGAGFMVLSSRGSDPLGSSAQIAERLVTTAIVWLGYSEGHTVVAPNLEDNTKNLAIWPEDLIYPANPLISMSVGPSDLQVTPGVWRREFATCYQQGAYFGRCAAVVNSNASAVTVLGTWFTQSYGHVISLVGGDVLSGGSASVNSAPFVTGVTTVPAYQALLLAQ
jgi:hypothetical protein